MHDLNYKPTIKWSLDEKKYLKLIVDYSSQGS